MRSAVRFLFVAFFLISCVGIVMADLDLVSEGQNNGSAVEVVSRFPLGFNTAGQDTSTGCTNNPQAGSVGLRTPLQQLAMANEATTLVANNNVLAARGQAGGRPGGPGGPGGPGKPGKPDKPGHPNYPGGPGQPGQPGGQDPPVNPGVDPPSPATTPEPGTMLLFGMGIAALAPFASRYRRKK